MQNRRHPRDPRKKEWFLIPGARNPAIDPTAPFYPLAGIPPKLLDKKVKKEKRPIKSLTTKRKASSKATRKVTPKPAPISTPVIPSDPPLDDVSMRDSVAPESPNSSGDSNGSAVSTPRMSPSAEVEEEEDTPILTLDDLTLREGDAAITLLTMGCEFTFQGKVLEFTPYVLPIAPRYPESSVRSWSPPDDEVATQAYLPLLRHVI
jgi:hypothetical protein